MALISVNQYGEKRVRLSKKDREALKVKEWYGVVFSSLGSAIANTTQIVKASELKDVKGAAYYQVYLTDGSNFITNLEGFKALAV